MFLPGDTFACRQPDPVLQQAEFFDNYGRTVTDAFKGVCHYYDRIVRPEQLMTACINAMRVLTDPADTGAVCLAMPQDVEGEAYDYPEHFLQKRVWHMDRRPITSSQLERAANPDSLGEKAHYRLRRRCSLQRRGERTSGICREVYYPNQRDSGGQKPCALESSAQSGRYRRYRRQAANVIGRDADLIIGVGTRFTDFTTSSKWLFNENRKVIGINICPFDAYKMDAKRSWQMPEKL